MQVSSTAAITNLVYGGASPADLGSKPLLVRNTLNGLVTTTGSGFDTAMRCSSAVAGDFDNDMDEDLFVSCTGGTRNLPNRLFLNNGSGKFTEVANAGGAAGRTGAAVASGAGTSDSVVVADYDRDGFLDLLVTNGLNMRPVYIGGPKQLFHNRGNGNNWIELDLRRHALESRRRRFRHSRHVGRSYTVPRAERWLPSLVAELSARACGPRRQHYGGCQCGMARRHFHLLRRLAGGASLSIAPGRPVERGPALASVNDCTIGALRKDATDWHSVLRGALPVV